MTSRLLAAPLLLALPLAALSCRGDGPDLGDLDITVEPPEAAIDVALDAVVRITLRGDDVTLPEAGPAAVLSLTASDGGTELCTDVTLEVFGEERVLTCAHEPLEYWTQYDVTVQGLLTADGEWTWPRWSSWFKTEDEPPPPTPAKVRWFRVVPARSMAGGTAVAEFRFDRPVPGAGTPAIDAWTPMDETPEIQPCEFQGPDRDHLTCELDLALGCMDTVGYAIELIGDGTVEHFLTNFNTADDPFDYPGGLDSGCWPTFENEEGPLEDFAELEVVPRGKLQWRFVQDLPDMAQANVYRDLGGTEGVAVSVRFSHPADDGDTGGIGLQISPADEPEDLVVLARYIGWGTPGTPFAGLTAYVTKDDDGAGSIYVPDPDWWTGVDTDALEYLCVVVYDRQVALFVSEDGWEYTRLTSQNTLLDAHAAEITEIDHPWECPPGVGWCTEGETLEGPIVRLMAFGAPAAPGQGFEPAFDHVRFQTYPLTGTAEDCPGPMDRVYGD